MVDNTNTTTRRQTLNLSDTAKFVPGTYDLIVQAPGYGIQRFTRTFTANQTASVVFSLKTNQASLTKGATVTTTANTADKNNLIDDTEDTGAQIAAVAPVAGSSITVHLAGSAPVTVSSVNVSTAAGPNNSGRFTGVRKFEIRTCNGTCANPVTDFTNVAFTSPDDAFPGDVPRPLQPNLNLRTFTFTPTLATHVQLRVLSTQCTGQTKFAGDQDDDPFNNSDCLASTSAAIARATELEVFSSCSPVNVAASAVGATVSASSVHASGLYPAAAAINGDRKGNGWGTINGGWNDGTRGLYDDTLEVDFLGSKTISQIDVYTLQNGWKTATSDPDLTTSASGEGILDFDVEYWNGSAFVAPPGCPAGCSVIGNDKALRRFTFPSVATTKIQVVVHNSRSNYSRIVELEAYSCQ